MPPARLSADTTAINAATSCPWPASQANSRLLPALSTAPSIRMRITPKRRASRPPAKVPASVITTPDSLVTAARPLILAEAHVDIERLGHDAHHHIADAVYGDQRQDRCRLPAMAAQEVGKRL